ncbi:hypothetical protein [Clostridium perfringens]|uniref:hypothetical protein n=1 Tax=Clostridium perfringens TaxID=1502 RepID=UPI0024BD00B2|nr:hypothetical protein [Clostridium perfringens]
MKLLLESSIAEFVTIYDENNKEIVMFQSDEIDKLEDSISKLLEYLNVEHEWKTRNRD